LHFSFHKNYKKINKIQKTNKKVHFNMSEDSVPRLSYRVAVPVKVETRAAVSEAKIRNKMSMKNMAITFTFGLFMCISLANLILTTAIYSAFRK
jgi:hypothetical protein